MNDKAQQKERNAVTIGEILDLLNERLEREIGELSALIRKGYHHRHEAEKYLSEKIGTTLAEIDNVNSFAGQVVLFGKRRESK